MRPRTSSGQFRDSATALINGEVSSLMTAECKAEGRCCASAVECKKPTGHSAQSIRRCGIDTVGAGGTRRSVLIGLLLVLVQRHIGDGLSRSRFELRKL
jgi:hypothetical protein